MGVRLLRSLAPAYWTLLPWWHRPRLLFPNALSQFLPAGFAMKFAVKRAMPHRRDRTVIKK